jgi:GAF domain-containing protein
MYDEPLFLRTLSKLARVLPASYDVGAVLAELTGSVTGVLGLAGSGVSLAEDGKLRFVTAVTAASSDLERVQEQYQRGPCREAFDTGESVSVPDVRLSGHMWPEFAEAARRVGVAGVAGIPMRLADQTVGALDLYAAEPREWSDTDLSVAGVLADAATSYIVNASSLRQQQQLNEQLQQALDSRIIIEQAKGITAQHDDITVEAAYERMRRHARDHNGTLRMVAEAIVNVGLRV